MRKTRDFPAHGYGTAADNSAAGSMATGSSGKQAEGEAPKSAVRGGDRHDRALLAAWQAGDEKAFAELYNRYKPQIYTFCVRMLGGDADLASDAFQETFIKVYQKAEQFREGTNVLGWLFKIARNTCLNHYRSKKPVDPLQDHALVSTDRSLEPEFPQEQNSLRQLIEMAINTLSPEFREPFILREFDGVSYAEIAQITGTTIGVTKVRIYRAKQRMRIVLRPYLSPEDYGGSGEDENE